MKINILHKNYINKLGILQQILFFPGLGSCSCTDCEEACAPPDFSPYIKSNFGIIDGIDIWAICIISGFVLYILIGKK